MIRPSRALKDNTAQVATFISLLALVACSVDSRVVDVDDTDTDTPGLQGAPPGSTDTDDTTDGAGTPAGGMMRVGSNPSGEGNPIDALLTPPGDDTPATEPPQPTEPPAFVENTGEGCVIPALPTSAELRDVVTLPDPFLGLNGQRITSRAQWRCRREEIRQVAERFIYGQKPTKPETVTGTVSSTSITVNVTREGRSASFSAAVRMPAGVTGPVPAIIVLGPGVFQAAIEAEGVASITYGVEQVGDEATNNPKLGAFYTVNPDRQDTGMLTAWAWGVSRILDVLESSGAQLINPEGVGVHGCSRFGKGAFIAGAFDERVALTIPYESGMAGTAAFRYVVPEGGEVLRNAIEYRPWAGEAYRQFLQLGGAQTATELAAQNVASGQLQNRLPLDTHEVIGLIAPRGLLVLGNPAIADLAPRAEQIAVLAGAEIYAALGVKDNISYTSNTEVGTHCAVRQEFVPTLQQSIRKFLKKDATAATGVLDADATLMGQLAPNVAWQTPTLE